MIYSNQLHFADHHLKENNPDFLENEAQSDGQEHFLEKQTTAFHPDSNYDFPVTVKGGIKRKCNFKYFVDGDWLTYDISKDWVFCHVCKEGLRKIF